MNYFQIRQALFDAKVPYRDEWFMSNGFHGVRFVFKKKDIKRVEKALPKTRLQAFFKEWCIEIF